MKTPGLRRPRSTVGGSETNERNLRVILGTPEHRSIGNTVTPAQGCLHFAGIDPQPANFYLPVIPAMGLGHPVR